VLLQRGSLPIQDATGQAGDGTALVTTGSQWFSATMTEGTSVDNAGFIIVEESFGNLCIDDDVVG